MRCRTCGRDLGFDEVVKNGICSRCRAPDGSHRGAFGAGIALLLAGFRIASRSGSGSIGVVVIGLGLVAFAVPLVLPLFLRSSPRRLADGSTPDDESEDRRQIAGQTCPVCESKILSVLDGLSCDQCAAPCHEECLGRHMSREHEGASTHPYRRG